MRVVPASRPLTDHDDPVPGPMRSSRYLIGSLLCLTSVLSGCSEQVPSSPTGAGPLTIVFTHGKLSGDSSSLRELLGEFERGHPGLRVREEILPASTDEQHQFYVINLEGRSVAFDVLAVDTIWVQEFAKAGWIESLDSVLPPIEQRGLFPSAIHAATFAGRLYAIPWYMDAGLLYYRRDLLDRYGFAPPRTWPELARIARVILTQERDPALTGFVWQGKQYEGLVCVALEFLWGNGADLFDEDPRAAVEALAAMRQLIVPDGLSPPTVATADEEATRRLFGAGHAIFMRNWPYVWSLLQAEGSPVRGKIGLRPLPAFPGHASVSALGGWMLAVPRQAAHPREGEALIRFLSSPEAQRRMALEQGYQPARRMLYQEASLRRTQPWLADLYPVFLAARPRPVTPYYLMLSQALQPELSAVVVGAKSPQAALASARRQIARLAGFDQEGATPLPKEIPKAVPEGIR